MAHEAIWKNKQAERGGKEKQARLQKSLQIYLDLWTGPRRLERRGLFTFEALEETPPTLKAIIGRFG